MKSLDYYHWSQELPKEPVSDKYQPLGSQENQCLQLGSAGTMSANRARTLIEDDTTVVLKKGFGVGEPNNLFLSPRHQLPINIDPIMSREILPQRPVILWSTDMGSRHFPDSQATHIAST
jgi:hypothetical protein